MILLILKILLLAIPIAWTITKWVNSKAHKLDVVRAKIKTWEGKEAYALSHDDVAMLNYAHAMLKQLRSEAAVLNKR